MTRSQWNAILVKKVKTAWKDYTKKTLSNPVKDIFSSAEEIAATRFCYEYLTETPARLHDDDLSFLLQFQNPLEVVRDLWLSEQEYDPQKEIAHALWELREYGRAEQLYEIDRDWVQQKKGEQTAC